MAKALTTLSVDKVKPDPAKRREIPDAACPGLYLVVRPSGRKSFAVRTRTNGKPLKVTLKTLELAKARTEAARLLEHARHGRDPRAERAKQEAETVRAACELWLAKDQNGNRTAEEVRRIMNREVLPYIGDMPIADVRKRDLILVIDRIAERVPGRANKVLSHVKRLFAWAGARDLIETNIARDIARPAPLVSRDRVLTDMELRLIWQALRADDFGDIVRLLTLTGQRLGEVSRMRWSELSDDLATWSLPGERTKNGRPHVVPLPEPARVILTRRQRSERDHIFGLRDTGFSGYSNCKERLDARIARSRAETRLGRPLAADEQPDDSDPLAPWRVHDLRRTASTGMGELGVSPHIIEAVLNHVSGTKAGVAGTYNRAAYLLEKKEGLERWAEHVQTIIAS